MNWKKLIISITICNVVAYLLIELWMYRYAGSSAQFGAGFVIAIQIIGYYISAILSRLPAALPDKFSPANCPKHDWQLAKYSGLNEQCVICGAERGAKH